MISAALQFTSILSAAGWFPKQVRNFPVLLKLSKKQKSFYKRSIQRGVKSNSQHTQYFSIVKNIEVSS